MGRDTHEKRVQVVGEPPVVNRVPVQDETDSENEREVEEEPALDSTSAHDKETGQEDKDDEGIEELMSAFEDDETELDLTHLRIKSTKRLNLPRFSKTLQRLNLRQNEIHQMRGKDLGSVPHLKELDLYDNAIEHIGGLDGNEELEYVIDIYARILDLSFNNIRHVSRVTHLGRCHTLYLVQNKIARLRPTDFSGPIAVSLRSLELGGNRLRSLENLSQLTNLEELWVGKNKIASLEVRAACLTPGYFSFDEITCVIRTVESLDQVGGPRNARGARRTLLVAQWHSETRRAGKKPPTYDARLCCESSGSDRKCEPFEEAFPILGTRKSLTSGE